MYSCIVRLGSAAQLWWDRVVKECPHVIPPLGTTLYNPMSRSGFALLLAVALVPADALLAAVGRPRVSTAPRMMAKELVIWDCDGVLVDSEALLKTAEVEALHSAGFTEVTVDDCNRMFSGFAPEAGAVNFEADFGQPLPEHFFRDQIAGARLCACIYRRDG